MNAPDYQGEEFLPTALRVERPATTELNGIFAALRAHREQQRTAALMALGSLQTLVGAMAHGTGQSYKLRALLYSLFNGKPASLLEVVSLDWHLRQSFNTVLLAFGYEDAALKFFYEAVRRAVTDAGLWEWFIEEGSVKPEGQP